MAAATLLGLPDYLLESFVKQYLEPLEWLRTMSVSVHFTVQKKRSIYLTLNNASSQLYCLDKNFRKRVLSIIVDKRRQISLDLRSTPTVLSKHLFSIDGVHSVNLANNQQLVDVNMLSNVVCLDLSGCHSIRDVSQLRDVVQLILPRCYELRSLRGLEQVNTLNISGCHLIQDVSMLKKVESLTVTNCPNISDLSPLATTVKELSFTHCQGIIQVPALLKAKAVDFSYCDRLQVLAALPFAEHVTLNYCSQLQQVGKMPNVREVSVIGCKALDLSTMFCQLSETPLEKITICKCQGMTSLQSSSETVSEGIMDSQVRDRMMKKVRMTPSCLCN